MLSCLVHCHSKNIVHRDIKPENILFESKKPGALLKLIDFGAGERMKNNELLKKKIGTVKFFII